MSLEGAKGVGKTATALRRATSVFRLDDPGERQIAQATPSRLASAAPPVLIDEWQRLPESLDVVRRAVDDGAAPGAFILTGSPPAPGVPVHSGAGRIVVIRMRPMTLTERGMTPSVSLGRLLSGDRPALHGQTAVSLEDYVEEILASGFPGIRGGTARARAARLDGYLDSIVEREFPEMGHVVRNPAGLRRWLAAYAAASSTTASFEAIRDGATGGEGQKPSRVATGPYRDILQRLHVLDPVPAWLPTGRPLSAVGQAPTHQLVDPALAASLVGVDAAGLLRGVSAGPRGSSRGPLLGALFQSLVTLGVRVAAQAAGATVGHLRTHRGEREIDLIVERRDGRVLAIEVKLAATVTDGDVRHLRWLADAVGDDLLDAIVVTTGRHAFRRTDGIGVVPAALLGP